MAILYAHINKFTGQIYIGQTKKKSGNIRWLNGKGYAVGQEKFYRAIQLYGWDNFVHKIIESNVPDNLIDDYETTYISYYNTIKNGYNSKPGSGKILTSISIKSLSMIYYNDEKGILRSKSIKTDIKNVDKYYNDKNGILRSH